MLATMEATALSTGLVLLPPLSLFLLLTEQKSINANGA